MAASNYEKMLAGEWLAVMLVQTTDALESSSSGKLNLPEPARYFAAMIVYLTLAGAAMFGDRIARLSAMFGGLAALVMVLAPSTPARPGQPAGKPIILSMINYFDGLMTSGTQAMKANQANPANTEAAVTITNPGGGSSAPAGASLV